MEDLFFSKERFTKLSSIRLAYFLLFVFFFLLTETGREVYRPFIYGNQINDFGLADVVGNLLGTVAIIFFNLTFAHFCLMPTVCFSCTAVTTLTSLPFPERYGKLEKSTASTGKRV